MLDPAFISEAYAQVVGFDLATIHEGPRTMAGGNAVEAPNATSKSDQCKYRSRVVMRYRVMQSSSSGRGQLWLCAEYTWVANGGDRRQVDELVNVRAAPAR